MNAPHEIAQLRARRSSFKLNGADVAGARRRDDHRDRRPPKASRSRASATSPACDPDGNCRACMVEIKGERVLAPSCCRTPTRRHGSHERQRARACSRRRWCSSCCCPTCPKREYTLRLRARLLGRASSASASRASRRARQPRADLSHPAMAVNLDACIQCTRCVRACRDEQVNDVIGYAFRGDAREDRVRPGRSDGRLHLRRLRRMRAGLPDRRADAGARRRAGRARQAGRFGLPVLRRRLPAHLQRQGQQDPLRRGPRRPGQPRPPVRQGPLRLRLRAPPAAPDASR